MNDVQVFILKKLEEKIEPLLKESNKLKREHSVDNDRETFHFLKKYYEEACRLGISDYFPSDSINDNSFEKALNKIETDFKKPFLNQLEDSDLWAIYESIKESIRKFLYAVEGEEKTYRKISDEERKQFINI